MSPPSVGSLCGQGGIGWTLFYAAASSAVTVTVAGPETIAWLLRDSLTGARTWIAEDGQVWTTDS